MTLWVFGDSYVEQSRSDLNKFKQNHWIHFLATSLGCQETQLQGAAGAANEWIYYQFYSALPKIKNSDYVVFVSSQINRRWFFPNDIGSSNYLINDISKNSISPEEKNALKNYAKYLDNPMISRVFFENMCNSIHWVTMKKNLNLIILPGFECGDEGFPVSGNYSVEGNLFNIGVKEITGKSVENWHKFISTTYKGQDPRIGHLSYDNHVILSKKLTDTFLNKHPLDLNNGFREEFL
jgi:hypothetical protein